MVMDLHGIKYLKNREIVEFFLKFLEQCSAKGKSVKGEQNWFPINNVIMELHYKLLFLKY